MLWLLSKFFIYIYFFYLCKSMFAHTNLLLSFTIRDMRLVQGMHSHCHWDQFVFWAMWVLMCGRVAAERRGCLGALRLEGSLQPSFLPWLYPASSILLFAVCGTMHWYHRGELTALSVSYRCSFPQDLPLWCGCHKQRDVVGNIGGVRLCFGRVRWCGSPRCTLDWDTHIRLCVRPDI